MTDFYHDAGHARLRHLLGQHPQAAAMLKEAELEDFNTDLPASAFAWPAKRMFPVHSRDHAVVSYLYAKHASAPPPREVLAAIGEALDVYGVDATALAPTKTASAPAPEECLFPEAGTYPVRSAGEVKVAEERLLAQVRRLHPDTRAAAFGRLARAADVHGVKLAATSYRYAGRVYTDRAKLAESLRARAAASRDATLAGKFAALAQAVAAERLPDPAVRAKLARAIGALDAQAGLARHYDRHLDDPVATVFNTTKVASADDVDLGGGARVSGSALAQMPPSFYGDVFGSDIVSEIAPGGSVDPDAVKTVVATFPSDMKRQLRDALRSAGVDCVQV